MAYSLAAADESPEAVERHEWPGIRGGSEIVVARLARAGEPGGKRRDRRERTNELLIEAALRCVHDGSRRGREQRLIFRWHQIGAEQEDAARFVGPPVFGAALQHLHAAIPAGPGGSSAPCSLRTTRSNVSPFARRYSWALSRSRKSGSSAPSVKRASSIGTSPEMPYFQSSGWPRRFACTASIARSRGSAYE